MSEAIHHDVEALGSHSAPKNWSDYYAHLDPEHEGPRFSPKQEAALADLIQASLSLIESGETSPEALEAIERGTEARRALFEINMPFALYCARESVGIIHESSQAKLAKLSLGRINSRASGTYVPLSVYKSPYADLEQRQQSALEGLWIATAKYEPTPGRGGVPARFVSYAAYAIQSRLSRDIAYEERGIRLKSEEGTLSAYFRANPDWERDTLTPELRQLVELTDYHDFEALIPADVSGLEEGLDDDTAETLEDIWADTRESTDPVITVEKSERKRALDRVLDMLSEREAAVIRLRYGLDDGEPRTLSEIGDEFGVNRERIRQIESKAMARLRHPSRSSDLRDFLTISDEGHHTFTGDSIEARLPQLEYPVPISMYEQRGTRPKTHLRSDHALEAWQLSKDEQWDDPVRIDRDRLLDDAAFAKIVTVLANASSWHFDRRSSTKQERQFSAALSNRLDVLSGVQRMSVAQLEHLWESFITDTYERISSELGENLSNDQVGRFFSSILAKHIDTSEMASRPITLTIPEHADGKINFLASNLRQGVVKIVGNTGDMTAANNGGAVSVHVEGDVGDMAGMGSKDYAELVVSGAAGRGLGAGMRGYASIVAADARSVSRLREETTSVELGVQQ